MNRFNELDDFMRQTDSDLIVGSRKMYFDDGEWVVMEAASKGSRYFVVNRFPDAVPNALSDALQCLYSVEHSFATDESYCVCPQSLIPVFGNSPAECPYCHQPRR